MTQVQQHEFIYEYFIQAHTTSLLGTLKIIVTVLNTTSTLCHQILAKLTQFPTPLPTFFNFVPK